MANDTIPGITTSVIDQTTTEQSLAGGRVPFIPLFAKYGKGFNWSTTTSELKYIHGAIDTNRYGLGLEYANDSFQFTNKVLTYCLKSPDATYANYCVSIDKTKYAPAAYNQLVDEALDNSSNSKVIKVSTFEEINNKDEYVSVIDSLSADYITDPQDPTKTIPNPTNSRIAFSILAQAPGIGYNDLFMTFSNASDYEKLDSNRDGETNYKFNYIKTGIFENSNGTVKSMGDPFTFSLIDQDNITGKIVVDMYNGEELFVNQISKLKNSFISMAVDIDSDVSLSSSAIRDELRKYATIDQLNAEMGQANRLILIDAGKKYEVFGTSDIVAQTDGSLATVYGISRQVKADNFYYNTSDYIQYISFVDNTGVVRYAELVWVPVGGTSDASSVPALKATLGYNVIASPATTDIPSVKYFDGDNSYYQVTIDTDGKLVYNQVGFLRWYIYNYLLNHNIKMESGQDDSATSTNPLFNSAGYLYLPSMAQTCKARDILVDFFNNTQEIREVMYPKYDFDYVPDWSNNVDVINAIELFGDSIGITMPLVSIPPVNYNIGTNTSNETAVQSDYDIRNSVLSLSSYNTMVYSSQVNKEHISLTNGQRLRMPTSYYALMAHLKTDRDYSITEPVANITKGGLLNATRQNLAYEPGVAQIARLRNMQINTIIVEPDGTYFIDQLTAYKKASKLSRGYVVKVIHRMRKDLPKLLKDLVQRKETSNVVDVAVERADQYMAKYKVSNENFKDGIFSSVAINAVYNDSTYTLRLSITVNPIGTIEVIDIPIIVI